MRILLLLPLTSLIRHFESVALLLADRGHALSIATPGRHNDHPLPPAITAHPRITQVVCPAERNDEWRDAAGDFRLLVDCGRYLDEPLFRANKLRTRAFQTFVRTVTAEEKRHLVGHCPECHGRIVNGELGKVRPPLGEIGTARMKNLMKLVEQSIPSDPAREQFLRDQRPDVVLVSPLVGLGSDQADWVKSARAVGLPVGFPVFSWDNLTTKGLVHVQPDRVFVWNEIQRREAIRYHAVPADRITITGAPRFDAFLALSPSSDRESFCRGLSLEPSAPIITYLCSSDFVTGREVEFVERWIQEIRREPALSSCNVLIRPHPQSVRQWDQIDVTQWGRVGMSRSRKLNADQLLFDTLHHSAAVVGLNTSAQIEAGLLGKPVYTLVAPEFEGGQQGTVHFRYLLREADGFVELAHDFDEHRRQLTDAVEGRYDAAQIRRFIERFVRPAGLDAPATPLLADAIEQLGTPSEVAPRTGSGSHAT